MKHSFTPVVFFTFFYMVYAVPAPYNGVLMGTGLVTVASVLINIVQFFINIGLLVELRKSKKPPPKKLSKNRVISNGQPDKIFIEKPSIQANETAEIKPVQCIAYGKFSASAVDNDDKDYVDMASVTVTGRQDNNCYVDCAEV